MIAQVSGVSRFYTDVATFSTGPDGVRIVETFGITVDELITRVGMPLVSSPFD